MLISSIHKYKATTNVHTKLSEDWPEDGPVYERQNVARNANKTSNKLRVVHESVIIFFYSL